MVWLLDWSVSEFEDFGFCRILVEVGMYWGDWYGSLVGMESVRIC